MTVSDPVVNGINLETVIADAMKNGNDVTAYEIAMAVKRELEKTIAL